MGTLDGLEEAEVNWRPRAKDANSLLVIATHTLGAAEAHVLQLLAGQQIDRIRASEFTVSGVADPLRARLPDVIFGSRRCSTASTRASLNAKGTPLQGPRRAAKCCSGR